MLVGNNRIFVEWRNLSSTHSGMIQLAAEPWRWQLQVPGGEAISLFVDY